MMTISPQANTISAALSRSARKNATSVALKYLDRQWTYQTLNLAVNKIANHLLKQGLKKGDRVVAYGKNSDAYVLAWLAILRAGLVHVPTNFALSAEELRYVVQQSEASGIISDLSLAANVEPAIKNTNLIFKAHFHSSEAKETDILQLALADLPK
ncbi:MAG: AMP-binding protein, partial [Pseudomonadaceae bacterium]|nr:AMP-binding protein [Pseudomonadaceae bacterium]